MEKIEQMTDLLIWMTGGVQFTTEQALLFREVISLIESSDKGAEVDANFIDIKVTQIWDSCDTGEFGAEELVDILREAGVRVKEEK